MLKATDTNIVNLYVEETATIKNLDVIGNVTGITAIATFG